MHKKILWHNDCSTGFILHRWHSLSQTSVNNTDLASNAFSVHLNVMNIMCKNHNMIPNPLIPYTKMFLISNQNYALQQYWKDDLFKGMHIHFQKNSCQSPLWIRVLWGWKEQTEELWQMMCMSGICYFVTKWL